MYDNYDKTNRINYLIPMTVSNNLVIGGVIYQLVAEHIKARDMGEKTK